MSERVSLSPLNTSPVRLLEIRLPAPTLTDDEEGPVLPYSLPGTEWANEVFAGAEIPGISWNGTYLGAATPTLELRIVGCASGGVEVAELGALQITPGQTWRIVRSPSQAAYGSGIGNRYAPPAIAALQVKTRRLEYTGSGLIPSTAYHALVTLPSPWCARFDVADLYTSGRYDKWRYECGWWQFFSEEFPVSIDMSSVFASGYLWANPPGGGWSSGDPISGLWLSGQRRWNVWEIVSSGTPVYISSGTFGPGENISGGIVARGHCIGAGTAVIDWCCAWFNSGTKVMTNPGISGGVYLDMHAL